MAIDLKHEQAIERADLRQLRDIDINDVIEYVHEGITQWPTSLDLYKKYSVQRWNVYDLDFTQDKIDWQTKISPEEKEAFLAIATGFHHGERQVEADLSPELLASDSEEDKIFLTSQLEDEARHTIFFDHFYREVVGYQAPDIRGMLDASYEHITETFVGSFGYLAYLADRLLDRLDDKHLFMRFLTTYHLWIEGVLALSVMKTTLNFCRSRNVLPGYYTGFNATTRDESRHVQFGTSVMHRMLQQDPSLVADIHESLRTVLSVSSVASTPVFYDPIGYTAEDIKNIFMDQLNRKLRAVGVSLPPDLEAMAKNVRAEALAGG